jgi:tartrate dehydrogenase/decarboxylase/D-malate dehydrogenase
LKYAYDLAQSRPKKHLTSATKSNGIAITMPYWDERVEAMSKKFTDVRTDKYHIDILAAHFVMNPDRFDVVVASNLFGDILSDLGPACTGTIAVALEVLTQKVSTHLCLSLFTVPHQTFLAR